MSSVEAISKTIINEYGRRWSAIHEFPGILRRLRRHVGWYCRTYVRTPQRGYMMLNKKTSEILHEIITDEIIRKNLGAGAGRAADQGGLIR